MLSPNLVYSLDMAAAHGILDYDGAAFIEGTSPRYMGSPEFSVTPSANYQQPKKDEMVYEQNQKHASKKPLLKKILFGAVLLGVSIFGYKKLKSMPSVKEYWTKISTKVSENIKKFKENNKFKFPALKERWTKFCGFFKEKWNKLFHKNAKPTS